MENNMGFFISNLRLLDGSPSLISSTSITRTDRLRLTFKKSCRSLRMYMIWVTATHLVLKVDNFSTIFVQQSVLFHDFPSILQQLRLQIDDLSALVVDQHPVLLNAQIQFGTGWQTGGGSHHSDSAHWSRHGTGRRCRRQNTHDVGIDVFSRFLQTPHEAWWVVAHGVT